MRNYHERKTVDKTSWPIGPWLGEPDIASWLDNATSLACMIRRHPEGGYWCGYVGVPSSHPLHGKISAEVAAIESPPGGVQYCGPGLMTFSRPAEQADLWWVGFDGRSGAHPAMSSDGAYLDLSWVRQHVTALAFQLSRLGDGGGYVDAPTIASAVPPPQAPVVADPVPPPEPSSSASAGPGEASAVVKVGQEGAQVGAGVTVSLPDPKPVADAVATTAGSVLGGVAATAQTVAQGTALPTTVTQPVNAVVDSTTQAAQTATTTVGGILGKILGK